MIPLLIDFENIVKPNLNILYSLENHIKPIPNTRFTLGLVLIISEEQFNIINSIPKGNGRVEYLNKKQFIDSIFGYVYLNYNKKKKICEIIGKVDNILPQVLESVLKSIPNNVTLWIGISLDSPQLNFLIHKYIESGFHDPYICNSSPLGFKFKRYGLCMLRQNNIINNNFAVNDVKYVLSQFSLNKDCNLHLKLSDKTIEYLSKVSKIGSTINSNGIITQKEIAGQLLVGTIDNDLIHYLDVDRESIVHGDEEGVKIIGGLYNFHSHPQEAYDRHNVKIGWPSSQDYLGFLGSTIKNDTILHIVSTLEGIYVISLSEYWSTNRKKIDDNIFNFILTNYDLDDKKDQSVFWYVEKVNNIKYHNFPLFLVQFFTWYNSNKVFSIPYNKDGLNCFARQSTKEKFKYLYN